MEIKYIADTISTLENAVQEETLLDIDDYQKIALRILRCDMFLMLIDDKKEISAKVDLDWLTDLTEMFYEKMALDLAEDDDN